MMIEILETLEVPEASNEAETSGPVPEEFNVAALLEVTEEFEEPKKLKKAASVSEEMAANNLLNQGFGRTKACSVPCRCNRRNIIAVFVNQI